jgi:hypothetical protein
VIEAGPVVLQGVRGEALTLSGPARLDVTDLTIVTASHATARVGSEAAVNLRASGSGGSYSGGVFRLATDSTPPGIPSGSVSFDLEGALAARIVELDGRVTLDAEGRVDVAPVDSLDDTPTVAVRNGARLNVKNQLRADAALVTVTGSDSKVVVDAGWELVAGAYSQAQGETTVNGTLRAASVEFLTGTVSGSGIIEYTDTLTAGAAVLFGAGVIVRPANSPGILTINGNLEAAGAIFDIEIAGTDPGVLFDQLVVNGDANLTDATVNFRFLDGFLPTPGDTFAWLVVSGFASGLDTLSVSFFSDAGTVDGFLGSDGRLFVNTVTPIPLPPAAWALASAVLALGGLGRRRRRAAGQGPAEIGQPGLQVRDA